MKSFTGTGFKPPLPLERGAGGEVLKNEYLRGLTNQHGSFYKSRSKKSFRIQIVPILSGCGLQ